VFRDGSYAECFRPDERRNPFWSIYAQKQRDTLAIVTADRSVRRILDIGGGMGRVSLPLAQTHQYHVTCADISPAMLALARQRSSERQELHLACLDGHHLPVKESTVDCIVALDLLCHLAEPTQALREFHRALGDSGLLIIDSTNSSPWWALFYPRYMGLNPVKWIGIMLCGGILPKWRRIVKHYRNTEFLHFLSASGFTVSEMRAYGPRVCPKWHLAVCRKHTVDTGLQPA